MTSDPMTTPQELRDALEAAWRELEADALASDGPIRDSDVKDAIKRNRPRIEKVVRAERPEHPLDPEWWVCVWCSSRFPYTDGPDTLKEHSASCASHPAAIALAAARAEAAPVVGVERVWDESAVEALEQALTEAATDRPGIYAEAVAVLRELNKNGWFLDYAARPAPDAAAPDVEKLAAARIHDRLTRNLDWLKEHGATQDEYRAAAFVVYADLDSKPTPAEMEDIRRRGIERGWLAAAPPAEASFADRPMRVPARPGYVWCEQCSGQGLLSVVEPTPPETPAPPAEAESWRTATQRTGNVGGPALREHFAKPAPPAEADGGAERVSAHDRDCGCGAKSGDRYLRVTPRPADGGVEGGL